MSTQLRTTQGGLQQIHQYAHSLLHSITLNLCTNAHFLKKEIDDDKNISLLQHDALLPPENVNRKGQ